MLVYRARDAFPENSAQEFSSPDRCRMDHQWQRPGDLYFPQAAC